MTENIIKLADETENLPRFHLIPVGDLKIRQLDWMIHGLFERDSLGMIFGDPAAGKSFMAMDIAACIATGTEYHDRAIKQGSVVYIAGEGHNGLGRRLKAWANYHQIPLDDAPLFISTMSAALIDVENLVTVMAAIDAHDKEPALVIIDTLARNFGPGDENSTQDMNRFVNACEQLNKAYKCTILIIHHTGHGEKTRSRGSSVLNAAVDTAYRLNRDDEIIRVTTSKMKDGEIPDPFAFEFRSVELGIQNEDGTPATSAILYPVDAPDKPVSLTGANQIQGLAHLKTLIEKHRANLESSGHDPDTARVSLKDWRDYWVNQGNERTRWYEARDALEAMKKIEMQPGGFVRLITE